MKGIRKKKEYGGLINFRLDKQEQERLDRLVSGVKAILGSDFVINRSGVIRAALWHAEKYLDHIIDDVMDAHADV